MSSSLRNGIYSQDKGELLVEFDTYIENSYHNSNSVAYEPLEAGSFSNDSKQNSPFVVSISAIITIRDDTLSVNETVDQVEKTLIDLNTSSQLLLVILQPMINNKSSKSQYFQLGKVYQNVTMFSLDYQNTPDQLELRPVMLFQQIRLTDTEFTNSQNTANPENSATVNQGQKQPTTVTNQSWLQYLFQAGKTFIFGGG